MRKAIGASLLALVVWTGCVSGDVDEEKPIDTVPAGITPESATFYIERRHDGTQQVLVIRLSTVSLCERHDVPIDHPYVEAELAIAGDAQFAPEDCRLDQTLRCRIKIARTMAPECAISAGIHASEGHLKIDEITEDEVRGSFVGTSRDSKVDLQGSFVARHCGGTASCP